MKKYAAILLTSLQNKHLIKHKKNKQKLCLSLKFELNQTRNTMNNVLLAIIN